MNFVLILGTARDGRLSEKVAHYMSTQVTAAGHAVEMVDVRDYRITATDATGTSALAKQFSSKITSADGLIIVSPEYNHSYPGELKMMLDMAYNEYNKKPVAICGVSNGPWGGTRMIVHLNEYIVTVHGIPTGEPLMFPKVQELFDANGIMKDASYTDKVKRFIDRLVDFATMVKK